MESSEASASGPKTTVMEVLPTELLNLGNLLPLEVRSSSVYEKLEEVGKGPFREDPRSQVYKARERETGQLVALKKIIRDASEEIIPLASKNEIKILKMLNHENIIHLKGLAMSPVRGNEQRKAGRKYEGFAYMVFDYMEHDLIGLVLASVSTFTIPQIKCYMIQLLKAVQFCHKNRVLHRDIKSANILLNNEGVLKLADFGLSLVLTENHRYLSNMVVSMWYRAPELLLGDTRYGPAIDMWSVGCIFGELFEGKPIFPGRTEDHQLQLIWDTCGTPDDQRWPGVSMLPNFRPHLQIFPMRSRVRKRFEEFENCDRHALDLLERMLTLNPAKRISAEEALDAEYFRVDPLPCDRKSLPTYLETHDRKRRKLNTPATGEGEDHMTTG